MARHCAAALALLLTVPSFASAFYLPGAAPKDYQAGERIPVNVNRLNPLMNAIDSKIVRSTFDGRGVLTDCSLP